MSMMQLHEDIPISEYVQFPIIEIDSTIFQGLSDAYVNEYPYTSGSSIGRRISIACRNNSNLYTALSSDCPRNVLQNGSIIKNKNVWENVQGVYQRSETTMERVTSQPSDFSTSMHYYTSVLNTPTQEHPEQYIIYNSKSGETWSSSRTYYKDISQPEKRMCRTFFSDAGLSFSCFASGYRYSIDGITAKFTNVCAKNGNTSFSENYVKNNCWTVNGNRYNPYLDTYTPTNITRSFVGEMVFGSFTSYYPQIKTTAMSWQSLQTVIPCALCFVHYVYDNTDFYGVAYLLYNEDSDNAIPITLLAFLFSTEYWGSSIIAGGVVPSGSWGPTSGQSGGSGSWDNTDDSATIYSPVTTSTLPSALAYGGIHMYAITHANLAKLSGLLFSPTNATNFWSKWLNQKFNPIAGIISLHTLPTQLRPAYGLSDFAIHVSGAVLNETYMGEGNAITAYDCTEQYKDTSEYTLSLPEYFGSFYDYEPYTKCYLHLPFCGVLKISANEILGGSISVQYRCDCLTGNVGAMIKTTDRNNVVKMQYVTGNAAYTLPIVGRDDGGIDNMKSLLSGGLSFLSGNVVGAVSAGVSIAEREHTTTISGNVTGNNAPLSDLKLWLEVVRVVPSTPENKQEMQGIPANVYTLLYSISGTGYAEIDTIHLENIPDATQEEIAEIESILKNGAVF